MDVLKRMRMISMIWGMLLIGLFLIVTIFGVSYKKKVKLYEEQENKLLEACRKYVDTNKLYPSTSSLKITLDELKESGFMHIISVGSDECDGYVVVENDDSIVYQSYIKCGKYSTNGYSKNK